MSVTLAELVVADPPASWREAGFSVDDDGSCWVGAVRIRLVGTEHGTGIVGWALGGVPAGTSDVDGIPTIPAAPATVEPSRPSEHPNGVTHLDHVVLLSPDLARTTAALRSLGLDVRRERDGTLGGAAMRQVFFRLGEVILEVVGSPDAQGEGPSSLWGLTHTVPDIDAAARLLGERTSPVKDAVQPGRRITTLRHRDLEMSVRTALISPHVRRTERQ
ncbi:VOC family protein [Nocardioides daeguensis]|uniref:Glyoxalase/fosfomycin resistance/dioxygenase domain-containing protein n=1 Tax=Nocardioides daeguensis TaxID=908359 RepID=A0ABP6VDV3_9ACTN|nr:VOC family protein [Nocardioides daeguensis]MBV6729479.1 VOC family protein [Nocardioides daeguensis]MCR1771748.1 VOC family protein [Nocardioides daeguensis]